MKQFKELEVGKYYAPVFERDEFPENPEFYEQYSVGGFYKYLGEKDFEDESGELVDGFYDPSLQCYVATDAPDGFVQ